MKKLLLSSVALVGLTVGAMAADLPRRAAPPVYAPVPVFTWTGFYVGVNAGFGWNGDDNNNCFACFGGLGNLIAPAAVPGGAVPITPAGAGFPAFFGGNRGNDDGGFVGGAQVGFNWQLTPGAGFVIGVEADIQWADLGGNGNNGFFGGGFGTAAVAAPGVGLGVAATVPGAPGNVALFSTGNNNRGGGSDWFATARLRVGYAFDRVLVYATGGLAFTDDSNNNNNFLGVVNGAQLPAAFYVSGPAAVAGSTVGRGFLAGNSNSNDVGWTLGGGVEWAFTNNLTFKVEGLWVSMDDNNNNNAFFAGNNVVGVTNTGAPIVRTGGGFLGVGNGSENEFFIARVGINWKFGS
jgi:outer membrane immunogenic protein